MNRWLSFSQNVFSFELRYQFLSGFEPVHALIRIRYNIIHPAFGIHNIDHIQIMTAANLKIIEIMSWRNLDRA